MKTFNNIINILKKPDVFFYSLIWLMVILTVGTVAQKYVGLYRAQNTYFSSFYFFVGPIPLPGGYTTLGLISINLFVKLFFASPWRWKMSGTIITHVGALLLLFGGLLTSMHSKEGSMLIYEGDQSSYFSDYHARELIVYTLDDQNNESKVKSLGWNDFKVGQTYPIKGTPLTIEILKKCLNCETIKRNASGDDASLDEYFGRAKKFDIRPIELEKENEKNQSGVFFRVKGSNTDKDGVHFSVDYIESAPWVEVNGQKHYIALRRERTYLPFGIKLIDFDKKYYPGTNIPHAYKSEVIVVEGDTVWRSIIQMNEPLRYRGYTFYQASYVDTGKEQATVLAVVKNAGRLFPYISSITMCIGLLIHMFINIPRLIKK